MFVELSSPQEREARKVSMELPECPVCLQSYDEDEKVIPRVLSCGHSACESCISQLPRRFPNTVSCPACTQLVKFPESQGPSALPKNIDLLRFCFPQSNKATSHINQINTPNMSQSIQSKPISQMEKIEAPRSRIDNFESTEFLPRLWSQEFYCFWKDWVLPSGSITIEFRDDGFSSLSYGKTKTIANSSSADCNLRFHANQCVSLLPVPSSSSSHSSFSGNEPSFRLSYTACVMNALYRMGDRERNELGFIMRTSLRQRRISAVYGVWMDEEDGSLFLVCEKLRGDLSKRTTELKDGIVSEVEENGEKRNLVRKDALYGFAVLGAEMCEVLMVLCSEGIVSGCLAPSCFAFDSYGRFVIYLNDVLALARRVQKSVVDAAGSGRRSDGCIKDMDFNVDLLKRLGFVSPEMLTLLHNRGGAQEFGLEILASYGSDVWSLACILIKLLIGEKFNEEPLHDFYCHVLTKTEENYDELVGLYTIWMEKAISTLESLLGGAEFDLLVQILSQCLSYDPGSRPHVNDLWSCIRGLLIKPNFDILVGFDISSVEESAVRYLILGDLCLPNKVENESQRQNKDDLQKNDDTLDDLPGMGLPRTSVDVGLVAGGKTDSNLVNGLHMGDFESVTLQGHRDCITGFAVGGGFLFSSSFDKTVHLWSLQDYSHVQSLRGHEHRVMAVVVVDTGNPLCISGDSGGGIFVWGISAPLGTELLKKWYEHSDWRYSGVHSLAVSGTDYLYNGSGDKSIKAWSMKDYTLACTMNGHKSVVSSLTVCNGILYSGSWDGTIRLWWISDHSPLTVLEDDKPENLASVLSLSVDHQMLVAACENGYVKMWKKDVLASSKQSHDGAIFAIEKVGRWMFMGGWSKMIDVQELVEDEFHVDTRPIGKIACDSVITALLYWQGKLFVGFADKAIKVYFCRP